jgi:hypothetical protein
MALGRVTLKHSAFMRTLSIMAVTIKTLIVMMFSTIQMSLRHSALGHSA